jgi:hypothetical protein
VTTEILSIDVSSELETLCRAQLRGTWQIPAELVRLAEVVGAKEVSISRRRFGFEIFWNGPPIDVAGLFYLRTALDPRSIPDERQRAIAAIEEAKMEALLWASGLRGAHIRAVVNDGEVVSIFDHRYRKAPRMNRGIEVDSAATARIRWTCAGLDRKRAVRWLNVATRFVRAEVMIDGHPGPRGFAGGQFHVRLEDPLPCTLALTGAGDRPVLWLLRDGVVSARASVPDYPPFEAAVELAGIVESGASAADMRRAVTPYLGALVDRAVWMMVEVSDRFSAMSAEVRDRHCLSLLRAAGKGIRSEEICRLALLRNAGGDHRFSVEDIRRMAEACGGVLPALDPGEPGDGLVDPSSTVLASSEARAMVTELTGVRFQAPARRASGPIRRIVNRLRQTTRRLGRLLRGFVVGRRLTTEELRAQEVFALDALQSTLAPTDVRLCEGRGSAAATSSRVVIPRASRSTVAGIDLFGSDPVWLYPLLLALDTGFEPPEKLRRSWLQKAGQIAGKS